MPKQNTHQNGASKLTEGKSLSADQSSANNNSANSVKTGARELSPTVAKRLPFHRHVTDKILNYLGNIKSIYQNFFKKLTRHYTTYLLNSQPRHLFRIGMWINLSLIFF